MVILDAASAVDGLARIGAKHVDPAVFGHRLERAVYGREADPGPAFLQHRVQAVSAGEIIDLVEHFVDRRTLARTTLFLRRLLAHRSSAAASIGRSYEFTDARPAGLRRRSA